MGFLGAAAPKRPFRPFWAVPKGPRAGARNLPWQSVPETPRARSTKPPHLLGRDSRTAGPGRVGAPGTPCRIPSGIDKKENNSRKSWRAVVDHNFTATCRRTMAQGFAHFPQSFPHRYVNSLPGKKVRETGDALFPKSATAGAGLRRKWRRPPCRTPAPALPPGTSWLPCR